MGKKRPTITGPPLSRSAKAALGFVMFLAVIGGLYIGKRAGEYFFGPVEGGMTPDFLKRPEPPVSILPGPPRGVGPTTFLLEDRASQQMTGKDVPGEERWCDISGNFYAAEFIEAFSYAHPGDTGPVVRVQVETVASTFRGRIEARSLKPNFAYQLKLRGNFRADREAFERIGYIGRWRLPGDGTNYTDTDYEEYSRKQDVEAYILFDYFVTDAGGNAVREFALDSSLHVLWNAQRQRGDIPASDVLSVIVDASNPAVYARPKDAPQVELLWAEREKERYRSGSGGIFLPPGDYKAELVMTEESFHSSDNDGGYWATVGVCPVEFRIVSVSAPETPTQTE